MTMSILIASARENAPLVKLKLRLRLRLKLRLRLRLRLKLKLRVRKGQCPVLSEKSEGFGSLASQLP
jgi:hypothetical protein